ncbi:hypothetical protein OE88DRAFT_1498418 [Heliocybe sulcata]|uniref:Chromo domain-containing protein n=1 Tax=Heliocybe sulcata TaxID=5364 RepID=A0A5C3N459_9AGAM|nr:hypothetical protein OE88DRAFT_1498418 [Heliocybe sulcata]
MPKARPDPEEEVEDVEDGDDGEEEEYEIEEIITHQYGHFNDGKIGYLVKWKGYEETENSWVMEADAQNATEAIDAYWDKVKKETKGGRKSDTKGRPALKATKGARGETPGEDHSSAVKRRRRGTKVQSDDEMDVEEEAPRKTARTSRASTTKTATPVKQTQTRKKAPARSVSAGEEDDSMDEEEDDGRGNMSRYYNKKNWESLIARVDTVERTPDDRLIIYFTTTDGKQVKEDSKICKERFPQGLLNFYEANLRWKGPA